jgi:hypothetical protein
MNSTGNSQNPYQTAFRTQKLINPVHKFEKQAPDLCTFLMCSRAESLPACGKPLSLIIDPNPAPCENRWWMLQSRTGRCFQGDLRQVRPA